MAERDPFDLWRFIEAQDAIWDLPAQELRVGRKQTHWTWFIFPEIQGLGQSAMAKRYAISSLEEARAYVAHPLLGARLTECTRLVNVLEGRTVEQIFGYPDNLKFHSSLTLFAQAVPPNPVFDQAMRKYFGGAADPATIKTLSFQRTRE